MSSCVFTSIQVGLCVTYVLCFVYSFCPGKAQCNVLSAVEINFFKYYHYYKVFIEDCCIGPHYCST